jgi:hypothetical protein
MGHFEIHKDRLGRYLAVGDDNNVAGRNQQASLVNAVSFGGKKKGADSGIDGIIHFKPGR